MKKRLILYIFKSPGSMPPHSPNKCMFGIENENFWNVLLQNVIKIYFKTHSIGQVNFYSGSHVPKPLSSTWLRYIFYHKKIKFKC